MYLFKNKQVIFYHSEFNDTVDGISTKDALDILKNLTKPERRLYLLILESISLNPDAAYFSSENLAKLMDCSVMHLNNTKSKLKKKGYLLIRRFKDEHKEEMVKVILGKDQVEMYLSDRLEKTNVEKPYVD